jgi:murein DD-endopeptidase MepM/ murein hydrolase activator NlpD
VTRGHAGAVALAFCLFVAGLAAGVIHAGPPLPPTTTGDTTTDPTTEETTTAPAVTTTTATIPTTTAAQAATAITAGSPIASGGCVLVAAVALLDPDGQTRALGPVAQAPRTHNVDAGSVAYSADASIVTASSISLHAGGCADGRVEVRSVSLFGGAIGAESIELVVRGGVVGKGPRIHGLTIAGTPAAVRPGHPLSIGNWGYAIALPQPGRTQADALAVHLRKGHAGLPAGTVLLVSFAHLQPQKVEAPQARRTSQPSTRLRVHAHEVRKAKPTNRHRRHPRKHQGDDPLKVTPPLGLGRYVFPVAGVSSYIDTYGAFRGDVPGNWHHGDDIFATLGTPVLAVADGTLNRVGWEHLGGWRLWVRDGMRNQFYYAHLSGYSPLALHSRRVKAGDVIGFIGNTGDAFTTSPHLHFEIHPHQLLRLDYNGAVNPTRYLDAWQHVARPSAPTPAHPPFPLGALRAEARFVWRQLLAARGLISHGPRASERPHISIPHADYAFPARRIAAAASGVQAVGHASGLRPLDLLIGIVAPAILFASALLARLRRETS